MEVHIHSVEGSLVSSLCGRINCLFESLSTGDVAGLKKETFVLKEGVEYRVKIHFKVSHFPSGRFP